MDPLNCEMKKKTEKTLVAREGDKNYSWYVKHISEWILLKMTKKQLQQIKIK